jgi:hypothetical protein
MKFVWAIILFGFTLSVKGQTTSERIILQNPDNPNVGQVTGILTAVKIPSDFIITAIAKNYSPFVTPERIRIRKELTPFEEFRIFQNNNKLDHNSIRNAKTPVSTPISVPTSIKYSFDANFNSPYAPLDNTIACSDDQNIISVCNGIINFLKGTDFIYASTLDDFFQGQIASPCDPKVFFDPVKKRFILFGQSCEEHNYSNSQILVGFSKSNDPSEGWNFYKISGNATGVPNNWFDYPKIGISDAGLFISGNIFNAKEEFQQTVLYQIDQNLGYNGADIKYRIWSNIPDAPFTLKPIESAFAQSYGPGMIAIGTTYKNNCDYYKLYEITDNIYAQSLRMNFYKIKVQSNYLFFSKAAQGNGAIIDNGDVRIQDGFLYNNKVYFVFTSGTTGNFSRINFNILDLTTKSVTSKLLGDDIDASYAYGAIAPLSDKGEPMKCLIACNSSKESSYPDIKYKICNDNIECTDEVLIHKGENVFYGPDRWGDYNGVAKNNFATNNLWIASTYSTSTGIRQTRISNIISSDRLIPSKSSQNSPLFYSTPLSLDKASNITIKVNEQIIYKGSVSKGDNDVHIAQPSLKDGDKITIIDNAKNKILKSNVFKLE